jgi:hypothetical protein
MLLTTDHSQRLTGAAGIDRMYEREGMAAATVDHSKVCHRCFHVTPNGWRMATEIMKRADAG